MGQHVVVLGSASIQSWDILLLELLQLRDVPSTKPGIFPPHLFIASPWGLLSPPLTFSPAKTPHSAHSSTLLFDFFHETWHVDTQVKAVTRFQLSLSGSSDLASGAQRLALAPLSTGYFPAAGYRLPEESFSESAGVCYQLRRNYPSYAYMPVDLSFPPNPCHQVLAHAGDAYPVTLVPLMEEIPKAACPFSGRVIYARGRSLRAGCDSILCVDYLP